MAKKSNQAVSAGVFVERWSCKGYEKGETQRFWLGLLQTVFGVSNPTSFMEFEIPVKTITKEKGRGEQALVLLCDVFRHSSVAVTKRYLGIRQDEILSVYDSLNN